MTVQELIELLEDQDLYAQVIIGHQPNYPLGAQIEGVCNISELEEDDRPVEFSHGVVIAAYDSTMYLTARVWENLYE